MLCRNGSRLSLEKMRVAAFCGPNDVWYEDLGNGSLAWTGQGDTFLYQALQYLKPCSFPPTHLTIQRLQTMQIFPKDFVPC